MARLKFQSTRPRGARPRSVGRLVFQGCFNPRAHGGRDFGCVFLAGCEAVSIHAPTGGATGLSASLSEVPCQFQSTRPRGARPVTSILMISRIMFQSTRPRGARRGDKAGEQGAEQVSIHAPTGGATGRWALVFKRRKCFNPRAHGGRDLSLPAGHLQQGCFNPRAHGGRDNIACSSFGMLRFQSTRPRGARHFASYRFSYCCCFNPRAHGGRDA